MTTESPSHTDTSLLELALDSNHLPVSYFSSLLRVVQAALREVARNDDSTRQPFIQQPQPVLLLTASVADDDLVMRFHFTDPLDSTPLTELSAQTFRSFVEQFGDYLKTLPQPGLWGDAIGGMQTRRHRSEIERRMDQLRLELRRFPKAKIGFEEHSISIEAGRIEIE